MPTLRLILLSLAIILLGEACKHQPVLPDPSDTGTNQPGDTTNSGGGDPAPVNPCDPDSVYFERDVLPILISNCAKSGCHDESSAQDGVILTDYARVLSTGKIDPFDPGGSDLWEVITETDPDKIMPPPPNAPLGPVEIALITKWINQGAQNLNCSDTSGCDTTSITFSGFVQPLINTYCRSCHEGSAPSGDVNLDSYAAIATEAATGRLVGVMEHQPQYSPMPKGGAKLPECDIAKVRAWVSDGAPDN